MQTLFDNRALSILCHLSNTVLNVKNRMVASGSLVYPWDPVVDGDLWLAAAPHHEKGSS